MKIFTHYMHSGHAPVRCFDLQETPRYHKPVYGPMYESGTIHPEWQRQIHGFC
jgi:hypothetical protein